MSRVCSSCNAENVDEAKFCRQCGSSKFDSVNKINKQSNQRSYADVASVNYDEKYDYGYNYFYDMSWYSILKFLGKTLFFVWVVIMISHYFNQ